MLSAVQAFVQKLAVCLLDVDRDPTSPMVDQMNNWTAEATCFVSCFTYLHISGPFPVIMDILRHSSCRALSPATRSSRSDIAFGSNYLSPVTRHIICKSRTLHCTAFLPHILLVGLPLHSTIQQQSCHTSCSSACCNAVASSHVSFKVVVTAT